MQRGLHVEPASSGIRETTHVIAVKVRSCTNETRDTMLKHALHLWWLGPQGEELWTDAENVPPS